MSVTVELTCKRHPKFIAYREPTTRVECCCQYIWSVARGLSYPSLTLPERETLVTKVIDVRAIQRLVQAVTA